MSRKVSADMFGMALRSYLRRIPGAVLDLDDAYALEIGDSTFCALSRARGILCWGNNVNRQVGEGTSELRARPVPVLVVR